MAGNSDLIDLDPFMIKKTKTGSTNLFFLDGNNRWQSLTNKRTGEFSLAKKKKKWWVIYHEKCPKARQNTL